MNDVLILGGGLAGGAAAVLLARAGFPVHLIEREAQARDKICGEFLSIEAQAHLRTLGIDLARLGAVPIDRVRLVSAGRSIETALPFVAMGLSRRILDEALLDMAEESGAHIERGVRIAALEGAQVETSAGPRSARHLLLATGKHDLRGAKGDDPGSADAHVGFKMHWRPGPMARQELGSAIELTLFEGGYAGLQMVGADVMNLCLVLRRGRLSQIGGTWDDVLAMLLRQPHLAHRLGDATPLFDRPLTIANLPYGRIHRGDAGEPPTLYRLGDQAAMTASLTGDGMAIALRSAFIVADCLNAGQDAAAYHARLVENVGGQVRRAMWLQKIGEQRLVRALALSLLNLWPGALRHMAQATRLPY